MKRHPRRSPNPDMVTCPKCGAEYDPRVQSSACHKGVRHYPIARVSEWQPPLSAPADKPKQRAPFQSDFRLFWDEPMSAATAPLDQFFAQLMRAQSFRDCHGTQPEHFGNQLRTKNMNSLTKTEPKTELAPLGLGDPFTEYADAIAPQFIIGDLLKFSKGDYLAGINNQTVPAGTVFTVNMDELMAGFVRWWDGKPTDHVMVRVADRIPPKKRIELGDDDENEMGNRR